MHIVELYILYTHHTKNHTSKIRYYSLVQLVHLTYMIWQLYILIIISSTYKIHLPIKLQYKLLSLMILIEILSAYKQKIRYLYITNAQIISSCNKI